LAKPENQWGFKGSGEGENSGFGIEGRVEGGKATINLEVPEENEI